MAEPMVSTLLLAGASVWTLAVSTVATLQIDGGGVLIGVLTATFVTFVISVGRIAKMFIRFAEAWSKVRITKWARREGVDPKDIFDE